MMLFALVLLAAPIDVAYHGPEKPGVAPLTEFQPPSWEAGSAPFIAVHETNLRAAASADAASVAVLALASKVKVVKKASEVTKVGYRADYWYEVEADSGAHGFVFGGALTPAGFTADLDDDGAADAATVAWSPDYKIRVRFLKDGIAKQIDLQPGGQAYLCCGGVIHVTLLPKEKAGITLLQIDSDVEACGDYTSALVSFANGEPRNALETSGLSDPPNMSTVKFLYAPKKQQITVERKTWDDEAGEKSAEKRREVFKLKDGVFKSVKTGKSSDN